jgi:hypothetical protein
LYFRRVKVFLTFDYELFFGDETGSVDKCLIEPTNALLQIAKKTAVKLVFFVDVGYLIKLTEFAQYYAELQHDLNKINAQLEEIKTDGHDIQLHIHPHWEKSFYTAGKWRIQTSKAYKLSDFSPEAAANIVKKYKRFIDNRIARPTKAFRAGGWCIQPFEQLKMVFKEQNISIDSSVIAGFQLNTNEYVIDFSAAPQKPIYRFENDVCKEDPNGFFCEYPIASMCYSPLFFWRLYILGRLFPSQHKMMGDGQFISQGGRKIKNLTRFTFNHISSDGYYASKIWKFTRKAVKKNQSAVVIIGHPKGMTQYSLRKIEEYLVKLNNSYELSTCRFCDE